MFFPARRHNELVKKAGELFPITVVERAGPSRIHPWMVTPQWFTSPVTNKSYWRGRVEAGMVNAVPARVDMLLGDAPPEAQARLEAEAKEGKKKRPNLTDKVGVFLDEGAAVQMNWRRVGQGAGPESVSGDADSGRVTGVFEKVPEFFLRLGVKDANPNLLAGEEPTEDVRYLAASDIVVNQPRVRMTNEVTVGAVVDGVLVSVNPGFSVPKDLQPTLVAESKYVRQAPTFNVEDLFFQRFVDDQFDRVHLATVFALSPLNPEEQSIDATWNTYVRYFCHWNLAFATQAPEPRQEFQPLVIVTGLAGGIGDFVMQTFLTQNNDFAQAALDFYQQRKLAGAFWAV
jgi:hypothetical protein